MFADQRRALRFMRRRPLRWLWAAWFADRVADWLVLLALLVAIANADELSLTRLPVVLAAWFAPRLLVFAFADDPARRWPFLSWPLSSVGKALLVAAFLGAAAIGVVDYFTLLTTAAAAIGFGAAFASRARWEALRTVVLEGEVGAAAGAAAFVERGAIAFGALITALLLFIVAPGTVWILAAGIYVGAAGLATAVRRFARPPTGVTAPPEPAAADDEDARGLGARVALYVVVAFTSAATGAALLLGAVALSVPVFAYGDNDVATLLSLGPLLVAAGGLGLLVGPLPVPRLLLRISPPLLALALSGSVALAVVTLALLPVLVVGLFSFFVVGLAGSTLDSLRAIAIRRVAPRSFFARAGRISGLALIVGQLYGVLSVASISATAALSIAAALSVAQVILVALAVLLRGRASFEIGGLSSLPVKSVVHKLSWETRPAAEEADFASSDARVRRLAGWVNRHVSVEKLRVNLPKSGREYEIYRPTDESRERLFEEGRADPDKQMPYWAKVWPSGVALADVVVERKEEVASKHVLELGAGLGVTACAVLEYGGNLVTADYSPLPLAHCRLNTLANTNRAARATCFNWRDDPEVTAAVSQPEFREGFPLIIAGDVLYEGRDAEPLLNVIDRMLVADGSLWLAEPVRRTAQRFLDSAAALGWEVDSRQVQADWPDATNGPVNVHFVWRSEQPDTLSSDLGGWRI